MPEFCLLLYGNSRLAEQLGKIDDAIVHYRRALAFKPNLVDTHYNLVLALSRQNKPEEAIREYREALRLAPRDFNTLSNLGFELAQQN